MGTRGFITVATGKEDYYRVAYNLMKSYRLFSSNPLPFAILCDKENKYTREFDDVIILSNPSFSFRDKVHVLGNIPYDETVFVESDCLAYEDLNEYFDFFVSAGDFSVIGTNYELSHEMKKGEWAWIPYEKVIEQYKSQLQFNPRFGSTIMYLKRTPRTQKMYDVCLNAWENPEYFGFNHELLDDQILAVGMSVMGMKCVDAPPKESCIFPSAKRSGWNPKPQMIRKCCTMNRGGNIGFIPDCMVCHFGSENTNLPIYKRETAVLHSYVNGGGGQAQWLFWTIMYIPTLFLHNAIKTAKKWIIGFVVKHPHIRKKLRLIEKIYKEWVLRAD